MKCARCRGKKRIAQMVRNKSTKSGFAPYCKKCACVLAKESKIRRGWTPHVKISREEELYRKRLRHLEILYGLSREDAKRIVRLRKTGKCAICFCTANQSGKWHRLQVDHDHETGKMRGLLCVGCNRAIGYLNDSMERAKAVVNYLKHGEKVI